MRMHCNSSSLRNLVLLLASNSSSSLSGKISMLSSSATGIRKLTKSPPKTIKLAITRFFLLFLGSGTNFNVFLCLHASASNTAMKHHSWEKLVLTGSLTDTITQIMAVFTCFWELIRQFNTNFLPDRKGRGRCFLYIRFVFNVSINAILCLLLYQQVLQMHR